MTDGEKAAFMRDALEATRNALPDTAHDPRHNLIMLSTAPSMVLAMLFDQLKESGL